MAASNDLTDPTPEELGTRTKQEVVLKHAQSQGPSDSPDARASRMPPEPSDILIEAQHFLLKLNSFHPKSMRLISPHLPFNISHE